MNRMKPVLWIIAILVMCFFASINAANPVETNAQGAYNDYLRAREYSENANQMTKIKPTGHPRVFFTQTDIPRILKNKDKPQNTKAWETHLSYLGLAGDNIYSSTDGNLSTTTTDNYNMRILEVIKSRAFDYAIRGNATTGRSAINSMLNFLNTVHYTSTNYVGQGNILFHIGVVYDWCYPLLTDIEKAKFAEYGIAVASVMEIKYPPNNGSGIDGHSVEAQLMRDQMTFAIALYDERPDIYENVAGRFFLDFVPGQSFLNNAHMSLFGTTYFWRIQHRMIAVLLFDKMGYPSIFGPEQQYVPYYLLYARRPDGSLLREGDNTLNNDKSGTYSASSYYSFMLAANYYHDPYLKGEALRQTRVPSEVL